MADLHSEIMDVYSPGPNSCNFIHFWKNLAKFPGGFAPTPQESSGFATADMLVNVLHKFFFVLFSSWCDFSRFYLIYDINFDNVNRYGDTSFNIC